MDTLACTVKQEGELNQELKKGNELYWSAGVSGSGSSPCVIN